jgi:hypothetical protein
MTPRCRCGHMKSRGGGRLPHKREIWMQGTSADGVVCGAGEEYETLGVPLACLRVEPVVQARGRTSIAGPSRIGRATHIVLDRPCSFVKGRGENDDESDARECREGVSQDIQHGNARSLSARCRLDRLSDDGCNCTAWSKAAIESEYARTLNSAPLEARGVPRSRLPATQGSRLQSSPSGRRGRATPMVDRRSPASTTGAQGQTFAVLTATSQRPLPSARKLCAIPP